MSTPKSAAIALRSIHASGIYKPRDLPNVRFIALEALNEALKEYAEALPNTLDKAYNVGCRQERWYPVPWATVVLTGPDAAGLQFFTNRELRESVSRGKGYRLLQKAAAEAAVLLKVMVLPGSASIVLDFLHPAPGRACIIA